MTNKRIIHVVFGVLCSLIIWQCVSSVGNAKLFISSPLNCANYFIVERGTLLKSFCITSLEAILGLGIAISSSFAAMFMCFFYPRLLDKLLPILSLSQVVPIIVLAPFFIILLGIGLSSKVAMAALISFFPIFLNFATGFKNLDSNIIKLNKLYATSKMFSIKNIYLPLAAPYIFSGIKVSANLAVIGAIVAEFSGAKDGLGKLLLLSSLRIEPEMMMCSLILAMILGLTMYNLIKLIEIKLTKWNR